TALEENPDYPPRDDLVLLAAKSFYLMQQYDSAAALLEKYPPGEKKHAALSCDLESKLNIEADCAALWLSGASAGNYPETALYRAGRELDAAGKKNEAYSAYCDCIKKYPRSAEALLSGKKAEKLKKSGAVYTAHYRVSSKPELRLSPERTITEADGGMEYSVLIGPFYNLKEISSLKKEMTAEFGRAFIVKQTKQFVLYVGKTADQEEAVSIKIRLAEEFGFNGTIVNLQEEDNREYIYGQ
ncbi:MAG: SPOR domain-containing protein, partial [Spirochaetota bacterium]